jgi:uncharacterized protein (DUF1778 family)
MPQQDTNRTARLEARVTQDALAILRRAAQIQGRSLSDFVITAAQEAAHKTISELEIIRLSREGQEKFAELLLKPRAPVPALKKAFERHRLLVKK